ncbi:DNA primase, partial [Streptomyces solincola]
GHVLTEPPPLPRPRTAAARRLRPGAADSVLRQLLDDVRDCAAVPEGASFTEKLNRAAYTAGGLVGAGQLADGRARELLREAADHARPQQSRRNESIITAALSAGARHPLHPKESHE